MDVETEVAFPCISTRGGFALAAKRPRTDDEEHHNSANSRNGFHENSTDNGVFFKAPDQSGNDFASTSLSCRRFFTIRASGRVYDSEDFRPKGETLYTPLNEEVMVNTRNIEQFTFTNGSFFIGDDSSRFNRTVQGKFFSPSAGNKLKLQTGWR